MTVARKTGNARVIAAAATMIARPETWDGVNSAGTRGYTSAQGSTQNVLELTA